MKSIESLRAKLQHLSERMSEDMRDKMARLEQNNDDILKLLTVLEQKHWDLCEKKEYMPRYAKAIETEKKGLKSVLAEIVIQRQDMENRTKQEALLGTADLEKLKAELKQDREDLNRMTELLNKEKVHLDQMRSDIQRQTDVLEQEKQDIKVARDKLEITKTELQKKKENAVSLFDEINREKTHVKNLTLRVRRERDELENVMNMITFRQKEQELKEDDIKRQTQELETSKNSVLAQREELELLRKDLNKKVEEVESATNSMSGEREQLTKMKTDNDKGREMLLNEKDIMDREREELKIREDQLMSKMKSIETLRAKLLQQNVKISEGVKYKVDRLKQNNEDVLMLYTVLE
ncbi:COP1-interactive protein 1-like, partial [Micropterus dolomieu]|uniref:COP1-interactive protein 1-like n=1 Tax=Micropterus dolomieu TaxID=147949 RepID=UPI001E8E896C